MRLLKITLLLFTLSVGLFSQPEFKMESDVMECYNKIVQLKTKYIENDFIQLKSRYPQNYAIDYLEDYHQFLQVILSEKKSDYKSFKSSSSNRLSLLDQLKDDEPYKLYVQAEIHIHTALLKFKFKDYLSGLFETKRALKLLEENQALFPHFKLNEKGLGVIHIIAGVVPKNLQWSLRLFGGLKGDINLGLTQMEEARIYAKEHAPEFLFEIEGLLGYLQLHFGKQSEAAWKNAKHYMTDIKENLFARYLLSNIAHYTGRNDIAIKVLSENYNDPLHVDFYHLHLMLGLSKMRSLDMDAEHHLKFYLDHYDGQSFIKEAYQKLAWLSILKEDHEGYTLNMKRCLENGTSFYAADRAAAAEAKQGVVPNKVLLQARLLSDGGYYNRGKILLEGYSKNDFNNAKDQLEFLYRKARIFQGLNQIPEAMRYFENTMQIGKQFPWYFSCKSALELGGIYETRNNFDKAKYYYQICLSTIPSEYKYSLHSMAKSGLIRIKGK